MQAQHRRCRWFDALAWVCFAGIVTPIVADASDVYFPATTAYHRRNYDPFDQTAPMDEVEQASVVESAAAGDVTMPSEIRLLGADPFEKLGPIGITSPPTTSIQPSSLQTSSRQTSPVIAAKFQKAPTGAAPIRQPEPLPNPPGMPPSPPSALTQADGPDEPGADWAPKPLSELTTNTVLPGGVLPRDYWSERTPQHVAFFDPEGVSRGWSVNTFNWVASCLAHNPLYFEEVNLERYGYGCGCYGPCCTNCVQSAVSAAHFFGTVPALPYKMAVDCPGDCDYTLGYYRPGSCPPWRYNCCSRPSCLGALSSGGVAVGLIFLIP